MKELANLEFLRQAQRPVSVISAPFIKLRVETNHGMLPSKVLITCNYQ